MTSAGEKALLPAGFDDGLPPFAALGRVGVSRLSVDLNLPTLVDALVEELGLSKTKAAMLRQALYRKDVAAIGRPPQRPKVDTGWTAWTGAKRNLGREVRPRFYR